MDMVNTMSNDNLRIWDEVEKTSPQATKEFSTGRFKGTAISSMYNVKRATAMWGPCGLGWGFEVDEYREICDINNDTIVIQIRLKLWYRNGETTCKVVQYGATKFAYNTAAGKRFVDEDAAKKAVTDALGKALSYVGFSADVYLGMYDDRPYVEKLRQEEKGDPAPTPNGAADSSSVLRAKCGLLVRKAMKLDRVDLKIWTDEDKVQIADFVESICSIVKIAPVRYVRDLPEASLESFIVACEKHLGEASELS